MKAQFTLLIFLTFNLQLATCNLFAQSQFQLAIGGTGGDAATSIIRTTDGGYAVAGYTYSFGADSADFYIVKLNSSGSLQWSRTVGGAGNDYAESIIQTTDGGYAVAGGTSSFGAGWLDIYIVKFDASGSVQWSRTVGGIDYDYAYSIIQTTDGGYVVAGSTQSFGAGGSDMYIVKLNASGMLQWSRTVGSPGSDFAYSIIRTADGGYAVAGYTSYYFPAAIYIVKLDAVGSLQWSKTVGGELFEYANSIIQTADGGYAVAGGTWALFWGGNIHIVKLDASGSLQWRTTVGRTNSFEYAYSIIQTTDGGYAVAGYKGNFVTDMYIVKLYADGAFQWKITTVGGTWGEGAHCIIQTTNGGYAAAGYTCHFGAGGSDMYIVKFDANWNTCGNFSSPSWDTSGTGGTITTPTSTVTSTDPTVTTPPSTVSSGGTVTTICVTGVKPNSNEVPASFQLYQNYPNPFNASTKIRFEVPLNKGGERGLFASLLIYDVLGREIATLVNEELKPGTYETQFDASNYPSGVYFYKLQAGNFTQTKRMILIK